MVASNVQRQRLENEGNGVEGIGRRPRPSDLGCSARRSETSRRSSQQIAVAGAANSNSVRRRGKGKRLRAGTLGPSIYGRISNRMRRSRLSLRVWFGD